MNKTFICHSDFFGLYNLYKNRFNDKELITVFKDQLVYDYYVKSIYLIISVIISFVFYILFSLLIKAFKYDDIKLKY